MILKKKIRLFIFGSLAILALLLIIVSTLIIQTIAIESSTVSFNRELDNIELSIQESYTELDSIGLLGVEKYVNAEQQRLLKLLKRFTYGETGHLFVLNQQGETLMHRGHTSGTQLKQADIRYMLEQKHGRLWYQHDGREWHGVFRHAPHWSWVLVLTISKEELFAYQRSYLTLTLPLSALLFILVFVIAQQVSRKFSVEIERMLHCLKQAESGDLAAKIELISKDDLGQVQFGINRMIQAVAQRERQLADARDTLEQKVIERTKILAAEVKERKLAQKGLDQFKKTLDLTMDCVFMFDPETLKFFYVNRGAQDQVGYRFAELMEMTPLDIKPEFDEPSFRAMSEEIMNSSSRAEYFITVHRHKDGHLIPVEIFLQYIEVEDEPSRFIAIVRDITERKKAEEALRKTKDRLEAAASAGIVGVWDWDVVNDRLVWDKVMYRLYGLREEDFDGAYQAWVSALHPEDKVATENEIQAALRGERNYEPEFRIIWPNGSIHYIKAASQTTFDAQGKPLRMIGVNYDVTELKNTQLALDRMNAELEQRVTERTEELEKAKEAAEAANHAKSIFLANISHELRTPLNAILGFAQLIAQDERIPTDEKQNLETINRSGQHLLSLINDVLEISKIEAGRLTLTPELVNLNELLTGLSEVMAIRAQQQGLAFSLDKSSELPLCIEIDVTKLRQILINLISNAIKFTKAGEVRITVSSEQTDERLYLVIDVSDTGAGVAEQDLERIFSPFYQTKYGILVGEGTGLGLTISREYTKLLGGELSAESQVGKGSVFHLRLPVKQVAAPEAGTEQHGAVLGLAPGQPSYRILIAEDNLDNQRLISTLLERSGFRVRVAADGQQAIEQVYSWQPHFIWMDMRMPVLDGYEATKRIKAIPEGANIKIAALTASAFAEDRDAILAAGCDAFVRKPIKQAELFQVMHELLGVQYRYDNQTQSNQQQSRQLDPQVIAQLPKALQDELQKAAEQLDQEALIQLSEQIRQYSPCLANNLSLLTQEFRFDLVLAATENAHAPKE